MSNVTTETYSIAETLANGEKVNGSFVVDYTYGGTASTTPSSATIVSENITASGGASGGLYDNVFTGSTPISASLSLSGGIETIGFSLSQSQTGLPTGTTNTDYLDIVFSDNFAAGSSSTSTTVTPKYWDTVVTTGNTFGSHTYTYTTSSDSVSHSGWTSHAASTATATLTTAAEYAAGNTDSTLHTLTDISGKESYHEAVVSVVPKYYDTVVTTGNTSGSHTYTYTTSSDSVSHSGWTSHAAQTVTTTYDGTSSETLGTVVCYAKGTLITTERGALPVEKLREGDLVLTVSGSLEPVKWLGYRQVDCKRNPKPEFAHPVRIIKDAFAPNQPERDLLLSPLHSIYIDGVFIPALDLVNGVTVIQEERSKMTYYHVELPTHNAIYADGMLAETYLDDNNRGFFITPESKAPVEMNPEMPALASKEIWKSKGFAKVVRKGQDSIVDEVCARLLERAAQLKNFQEEPKAA